MYQCTYTVTDYCWVRFISGVYQYNEEECEGERNTEQNHGEGCISLVPRPLERPGNEAKVAYTVM